MKNFYRNLAAVAALCLSPALASGQELRCVMTDYGTASAKSGLTTLVPKKAVHKISGVTARLKGAKGIGNVEVAGSKVKIRYFGTLKDAGEVEVTYTFSTSSGTMTARTRALKAVQWEEDHPERAAKYLVTGTCTMR